MLNFCFLIALHLFKIVLWILKQLDLHYLHFMFVFAISENWQTSETSIFEWKIQGFQSTYRLGRKQLNFSNLKKHFIGIIYIWKYLGEPSIKFSISLSCNSALRVLQCYHCFTANLLQYLPKFWKLSKEDFLNQWNFMSFPLIAN